MLVVPATQESGTGGSQVQGLSKQLGENLSQFFFSLIKRMLAWLG